MRILLHCLFLVACFASTNDLGINTETDEIETTEYLVRISSAADLNKTAEQLGLVWERSYETFLPGYHLFTKPRTTRGDTSDNSVHLDRIREIPSILSVEEILPEKRVRREYIYSEPKDPGFPSQTHFTGEFGVNSKSVWESNYVGQGITIAIVDDGVDFSHPDILAAYKPDLSYDFNQKIPDAGPKATIDRHGTSCAGLAGARDNNVCGVGVAFRSNLASLRVLAQNQNDAVEGGALHHKNDEIDIYNCSWGPDDNGRQLKGPGKVTDAVLRYGASSGRNGLGNLYVWASGNGRSSSDTCNYDGYTNSRHTIAVSAIGSDGSIPYYSEGCSAVMCTAPGNNLYTSAHGGTCRTMSGTSSSAPVVAGVLALVLEVNSALTYRDIQHLIVRTSRPVGSDEYVTNGAGRKHSFYFGFGIIDAQKIVEMAKDWVLVEPETHYPQGTIVINKELKAKQEFVSSAYVSTPIRIEWVEVHVKITIPSRAPLSISIESPSGVSSPLFFPHGDGTANIDWTFTSCRHWDEISTGFWNLHVSSSNDQGKLVSWTLDLYGTKI